MNLFTGSNLNNDECIFDVHSFARELDEDTLRTKVNGGSCGGDAPSAPSPSGGGNSPSAPTVTATTPTTNPGTTPQTNSGTQNPSNPSNPGPGYTGGGNEPSPEVMSNPQAYGYWKALQDLAKQQGDPDRYKDYNVLPDYKQNVVDKYYVESSYTKTAGWVPLQGIGLNCASKFKTTCTVDSKNGTLDVFTKGEYLGKDLLSISDYDIRGEVSLFIDGKKVDSKSYEKLNYPYWSDGSYDRTVGEVFFKLPDSYSNISIETDYSVQIHEEEGYGAINYRAEKIQILGSK